jgi:hypothetical protein
MTPLTTIVEIFVILFLYWIGEFVVQTRWQAENKTTNKAALFAHSINYTAVFCIPVLIYYFTSEMRPEVTFILPASFITHLGISHLSTKMSEEMAKEDKIYSINSAYCYAGLGHIICIFQLLGTYYILQYQK